MGRKKPTTQPQRFGIGEWYGLSFANLTLEQRRHFAEVQIHSTQERFPCLPRSTSQDTVFCSKSGGVCSLRRYQQDAETKYALPVTASQGRLRVTCPHRFNENGLVHRWIGETLLNDPDPIVLNEIGFLDRTSSIDTGRSEEVGRIDNVLVSRRTTHNLEWCAVEKQAVYFSGFSMDREWTNIHQHQVPELPFPAAIRRPDYRSSGPKRLMPQLQIKLPTLRRWGKRMAVIVDEDFFDSLGRMTEETNLSNADIAWFIVGFEETREGFRMQRRRVFLTTLEDAVQGLTAGRPVSQETFEQRIRDKLSLMNS